MYLTLDELKHEQDIITENNGVQLVYDSSLRNLLKNSRIDYSDKWYRRGYFIDKAGQSSC